MGEQLPLSNKLRTENKEVKAKVGNLVARILTNFLDF